MHNFEFIIIGIIVLALLRSTIKNYLYEKRINELIDSEKKEDMLGTVNKDGTIDHQARRAITNRITAAMHKEGFKDPGEYGSMPTSCYVESEINRRCMKK